MNTLDITVLERGKYGAKQALKYDFTNFNNMVFNILKTEKKKY